jgi:cyclopropane-fatty-acyl-phospholipid synthase
MRRSCRRHEDLRLPRSRLPRGGDIGIAGAYLRGEWDTPDLTQFLYLFCVNQTDADHAGRQSLTHLQVIGTGSIATNGRPAISMRIGIGNAFYSAGLDPSMTYCPRCSRTTPQT